MPKRNVSITGTKGVTYDLDEIKAGSRANPDAPLIAEVHAYKEGESPNPDKPKIGQIWLSKKE